MKKVVIGYIFSPNMDKIILINHFLEQSELIVPKNGYFLNGVGGHVEDSDITDEYALSREVLEESGLEVDANSWKFIKTFIRKNKESVELEVKFYYTKFSEWFNFKSLEEEIVSAYEVNKLHIYQCMPDLIGNINMCFLIENCSEAQISNITILQK